MQHAMAPKRAMGHDTGQTALKDKIDALAAVDASDSDFVSCYLDLTAGLQACEAFVIRRAAEVRATLEGAVRLDFECAVEAIHHALHEIWKRGVGPKPGSVALFARGVGAEQTLSVIRVGEALEPRLLFYPLPDLVPLARRDHRSRAFTLLLGRRGGLQRLDVQGDVVTPRAWTSYRVNRGSPAAGDEALLPKHRAHLLRRVLAGDPSKPLVIAGDGHCLDELTAGLPARAASRLLDVARIPAHLDQQAAIEHVRTRVGRHLERLDREIGDRLIRTVQRQGLAVAGAVASLEALRAGAAEALVLEEEQSSIESPSSIDGSGDGSGTQEWHAPVELVRLAYRQDVPIVFVASAELRDLGGAGCLLRQPIEIEILPRPASGAQDLDLVA